MVLKFFKCSSIHTNAIKPPLHTSFVTNSGSRKRRTSVHHIDVVSPTLYVFCVLNNANAFLLKTCLRPGHRSCL